MPTQVLTEVFMREGRESEKLFCGVQNLDLSVGGDANSHVVNPWD